MSFTENLLKSIRILVKYILWILCYMFPVENNKIVVSSYYGRGYGDNPKAIIEELHNRKQNLTIVWLVSSKEEEKTLPRYVRACPYYSFRAVYHLTTAKIWIDNCRKSAVYKKPGQLYIQTWHGFALKRIEADVEDKLDDDYVRQAKKESKLISIIVSDSSFMTKIYKQSFWYSGEVMQWGAPRNDVLIRGDSEAKTTVCDYHKLPYSKKIALYAPTFRADGNTDVYGIDYARLIDSLEKKFGGEFAVLVRFHPNVAEKAEAAIRNQDSRVLNATYYPDLQGLLLASDIVISDYSSLIFDFALTKKPCFHFAVDIDDYKNDRNFYFDLSKLPFPLATENDQLASLIDDFDVEKYVDGLKSFYSEIGMMCDGKASARCADWIIDHVDAEKVKR